ncbi:MAG: acyl carrier protein [Porticoccaceae bacterium]|jgi:acyl carrier protein|nr:acyl carrier protein [Porticoccaceae bacterium]
MDSNKYPTVAQTVCDFILTNHAVKVDQVDPSMSLAGLNLDSLEKLSLAMDLEEEFDIDIDDDTVEGFITVANVIDYVEQSIKDNAPTAQAAQAAQAIESPESSEAAID